MTTPNDTRPPEQTEKEVMQIEPGPAPAYERTVAPPPESEAGGDSTVTPPDCTVSGVELPEPPPATHRHRSLGDLWSRLDLQRHAIAYADARVAAALIEFEKFSATEVCAMNAATYEYCRNLEKRAESAERERDQAIRREETAWRRANLAEAAVRGWEGTMVIANLPMRVVPVDGWGPGEGEQVAIPALTPEKLTDILDRLAAKEREIEALRKDAERLDYIERTYSGMTNRERYLPVTMIWGKGCNGRTLREACDKYMKRDAAIAAVRGDKE